VNEMEDCGAVYREGGAKQSGGAGD